MRNRLVAAMAALVLALAPCMATAAEVVSGVAPSTGKPPSVVPGGSWNGSSTIIQPGDSDGYPFQRWAPPVFEVLPHRIAVTVASGASDSSLVFFPTSNYRQLYAQFRLRAGSYAATAAVEVAFRVSNQALIDSTAMGYWFPIGNGERQGKTLYFPTPTSSGSTRWRSFPVADSLSGVPFQGYYGGVYVTNKTGAQIIYDLTFLGVK